MNHSFSVQIAVEYGIEKAILLENFYFWFRKNRANKKNVQNGKVYTYNTSEAFAELFPYLTPRKIAQLLREMEKEDGLIESGQFGKYDRTKSYTLTEKSLSFFENGKSKNEDCNIQKIDNGKSEKCMNKDTESGDCLNTDINTNINTNINTDTPALDCSQTKNLVNTFFEKITKHNQEQTEQKKKIPISQNMIAFAQKEGRLILDYVKNEDTETVLEALDNYLTVANSDTWKTVFSLTAFLKNYNEYTPAFFDPAKYDKETDTEKIVQSFRQKMESDSRFDIGLFLLHKQDWLDAGRPHGDKYWEMQENWDC